jgi:hypothetical protein
MRVMALVWVAKGLIGWVTILDRDPFGGSTFLGLLPAARAAVVVFAVLDLVAGVGLWLTSTWGGVMWLLAIMSHILIGAVLPRGPLTETVFTVFEVAAVIAYIGLSWLASREG